MSMGAEMASRPVTRAFAAALDVAERETAFEMAASNLRFGPGVTRELGMDLREMGLTRVLVVTDRRLRDLPPVLTVLESLRSQHIDFDLFDQVAVEPTD
ncbi:MAG: iron-containing alcohol dehydrogenase, partial [Acidobacteria bacterium]|nr:iron-containing alcohol dehydrogenase [Acidobacteriota bacterium]